MKTLRSGGLAGLFVLFVAVVSAGRGAPPDAVARLGSLLPALSCDFACLDCGSKHTLVIAEPLLTPDIDAAHSEFCAQGGGCPGNHMDCGGGPSWAPAPFEQRLFQTAPADLEVFVARYSDQVVVSEERGALQVMGCNGNVIASYPIHVTD
jgi:hypothetical protein